MCNAVATRKRQAGVRYRAPWIATRTIRQVLVRARVRGYLFLFLQNQTVTVYPALYGEGEKGQKF